ncbi:hypothetical protein C8R48DRAFT_778089 [Suillus tomentosus]|nr:hypothetical protein C8R48DRAFT_778089 [Suillus tomentosus]
MTAYLAVTGHWVTKEWKLRSELLSFSELEESHSGKNMGDKLYNILKKYNITHMVQNLTSNNVIVNDKTMWILGNKLKVDRAKFTTKEQCSQSSAASHMLSQLQRKKQTTNPDIDDEDTEEQIEALIQEVDAATEGDSQMLVASLLLKVRGFIRKVCCSPQAKRFFKKCYNEATGKVLELLPYCKTQWGSWHGVIKHLLFLKKAVIKFANNTDDSDEVPNVDKNQPIYSSYKFSEDKWKLLTLVHKFLNVEASIQEDFTAEYYPTIWHILPLYEEFIGK